MELEDISNPVILYSPSKAPVLIEAIRLLLRNNWDSHVNHINNPLLSVEMLLLLRYNCCKTGSP